jgi:hypothetical protein
MNEPSNTSLFFPATVGTYTDIRQPDFTLPVHAQPTPYTRKTPLADSPDKLQSPPPRTDNPLFSTRGAQKIAARTGTFTDNLQLSVHRWFRYSAGFSAKWVESVMRQCNTRRLLDPFAGSGTALLAADALNTPSVGMESHPFVYRVAQAKTNWNFDSAEFTKAIRELFSIAKNTNDCEDRSSDPLLARIYETRTLNTLESLRQALGKMERNGDFPELINLLRLAITSILRLCSCAGTSQCQYVLPAKTKIGKEPLRALNIVFDNILDDRRFCDLESWKKRSSIILHDSRNSFRQNTENGIFSEPFDTVITSPPYPNNYDYADATRIEMTFWKEITGWSELQKKVRKNLMRSCSQHAAAEHLKLDDLLISPRLVPIHAELAEVCGKLAEIRLTKGGKKTYHTMIAAYFSDLADVFHNLREVTTPDATLCFVIGDSAPYGIYVPAERWLGELALSAGFSSWTFEKIRDRNVKWDNRVHDVPLKEGNLWIKG